MSEHLSGVHELSFDAYCLAAGINVSTLSVLTPPSTPAHMKAVIDKTAKPDDTEALTFGTWAHSMFLQPDSVEGAYHIKPKGMSFATKEGKAWKADHSDKPVIAHDEVGDLLGIRDSLWRHPTVKRLLHGAETERSLFARDDHGTLRKARLDTLTKGNVISDLKTCERADEFSFAKQIANYGYFRSAAYYIDICNMLGFEKTAFCFIAVEKKPPYAVAVWALDDTAIQYGRMQNERNLSVYRECMEKGEWPGYPSDIATIEMPNWIRKEMENAA